MEIYYDHSPHISIIITHKIDRTSPHTVKSSYIQQNTPQSTSNTTGMAYKIPHTFTSSTQPTPTTIRRRIGWRLLSIGDTVYIPKYKYNGTIIDFHLSRQIAQIMPHDFGNPEMIDLSELRDGQGIPKCIRRYLNKREIYYFDTCAIKMTAVADERISSVIEAYHMGQHRFGLTLRMHSSE